MADLNFIFSQFALAFKGKMIDDKDIAFPERLPRQLLNGTLDSLHHVDEYLYFLFENQDRIDDSEWHITVLRAGAYLGEVIRHAAPDGFFTWIDYDDYVQEHPEFRELVQERTTTTCAFLVSQDGSMSMPLNKVARYISEGRENSCHYFAQCDLDKVHRNEGD